MVLAHRNREGGKEEGGMMRMSRRSFSAMSCAWMETFS